MMLAKLWSSVGRTVRSKWPIIQKRAVSRGKSVGGSVARGEYAVVQSLPNPEQLPLNVDLAGTRILLLSNVANGLTKKVQLNLQALDVRVDLVEVKSESHIEEIVQKSGFKDKYELIICPFLTKRVPEVVWKDETTPCLIVHPGIPGDRGMSSLDWAIDENHDEWGITVLQADQEMDAGDIWSTVTFPVESDRATKTGLYNREVSDAAVKGVVDSIKRFKLGVPPMPLDYGHPDVRGCLKPTMKIKERMVDWHSSAVDIVRQIRKSDTQPGAQSFLPELGDEVVLFGGHIQFSDQTPQLSSLADAYQPGQLVAQKDGAVLIKAGDGNLVWVTHMKRHPKKCHLKLPAAQVLKHIGHLQPYQGVSSWQEIKSLRFHDKRIAMICFDFYNGAMSTDQCRRLEHEIKSISEDPFVDVVILQGGETFFSTGIHLNVIEAADDPAEESSENINAINDVIKALFSIKDKVTISALQAGAGAGGVMMAAAADLMWARRGTVLTPSYNAMHLFGSEYWTYFLPSRVGANVAERLTESGNSILVEEAQSLGLVDSVFGRTSEEFVNLVPRHARAVIQSPLLEYIRNKKMVTRTEAWFHKLEEHRYKELEKMRQCFSSEDYIKSRKAFVYH